MVIIWYYIRDFFTMLGDIIKHIFDMLISLISLIGEFGESAIEVVRAMPSIFIAFGVVCIVVAVLFKIINRNSKEDT